MMAIVLYLALLYAWPRGEKRVVAMRRTEPELSLRLARLALAGTVLLVVVCSAWFLTILRGWSLGTFVAAGLGIVIGIVLIDKARRLVPTLEET